MKKENHEIYLKNIEIENYGAIERLIFDCQFDENGNPYPIVVIGKNGSGKTLLLSNILESLIEFKRTVYSKIPEVDIKKLYKIGTSQYIREGKEFSYINLEYSNNIHFTNLVLKKTDFDARKILNYKHVKNVDKVVKDNFYRDCSRCDIQFFENNIFLYFPVDRYYIPNWLNTNNI